MGRHIWFLNDASYKNLALSELSLNEAYNPGPKGRPALPSLAEVTSVMEHACVQEGANTMGQTHEKTMETHPT